MCKMSKNEQSIDRRIAKARFQARKKWLDEHPEAASTDYGHAQGVMAQVEVNVAEGLEEPSSLEKARRIIDERYGVDTSDLPE